MKRDACCLKGVASHWQHIVTDALIASKTLLPLSTRKLDLLPRSPSSRADNCQAANRSLSIEHGMVWAALPAIHHALFMHLNNT